jgi:arylsulfatase A-like enzyme
MCEPDIKVPLIIKDGDLPKNLTIYDCVKHVDIFPTLLRLLGVGFQGQKHGIDLFPAIQGEAQNGFKAYIEDLFLLRGLGALQAIRSKRYKYIINQTTHEEELYNIETDPQELENLINHPSKDEESFVKLSRKKTDLHYIKSIGYKPYTKPIKSTKEERCGRAQDKETEVIVERLRALGYL